MLEMESGEQVAFELEVSLVVGPPLSAERAFVLEAKGEEGGLELDAVGRDLEEAPEAHLGGAEEFGGVPAVAGPASGGVGGAPGGGSSGIRRALNKGRGFSGTVIGIPAVSIRGHGRAGGIHDLRGDDPCAGPFAEGKTDPSQSRRAGVWGWRSGGRGGTGGRGCAGTRRRGGLRSCLVDLAFDGGRVFRGVEPVAWASAQTAALGLAGLTEGGGLSKERGI